MNYEYIIQSPCKINLSLDVHGKRLDGYHDLKSIFQLVSLEDTITARINNSGEINIVGSFDCLTKDNLIYKAALLYLKKTKIKDGINFNVVKVIPSGGGIGGGSSNCGSVLRLMNYIYNNKLSERDLYNIALELGSDVPFFLSSGTALVEGRGEKVTPINTIKGYTLILVNPGIHISTAEAFQKLGKNNDFTVNMVEEYYKGPQNFHIFKNSFEIALFSDYTFINDIKTIMENEGSLHCALSGSGSTMFGIFDDKKQAESALTRLSLNSSYRIFMVKPLSRYPEIIKREIT